MREPRAGKEPTPPAVPVVGIGASAGGLEAFRALLKALPPDTGMAFVLISHLGHDQKSVLDELLSKATSMPVTQVRRKTAVEPNHVYVIPPNKELLVEDGYLAIKTLVAADRPPMVIDRFFRSLALHRKSNAIGVILSGTGTDGTRGLDEIKGEDGITFVQDAASAGYGEMPRSAQSSADYVLPPDQIAKELKRIANHPYVSKAPAEVAPGSSDGLKQIFRLIQRARGVDFSRYKPGSVRRRIARRMLLKHTESRADYSNQLRTNKEELDALYEDLLITVTEFFRDPEVFDFLKSEIIPRILKTVPPDTPARVWVPGCASGEEAYSIAMCFVEASKDRAGPPVQIFATDVSEHSIRKARQAIYPENIATNVSPERLQRFFVKEAGGYHVNKLIRDMCTFAEQNVIADAPFSKMDLVSCRNLLIYLDTPTQKEVLHRFHYALKPTGFLLLGMSESTAAAPQLFEQAHKPERVYTRVHVGTRIGFAMVGHSPIHGPLAKPAVAPARPVRDIGTEIDQLLLRRFAPAGVLLNSAMDILQFRGSTRGLMEPVSGEASLNIFRMVRKELAAPLHVALHEARMSSTPIHKKDLEVPVNAHTVRLDLEVSRLRPEPKGETYFLVLFKVPRTGPRPGTRKNVPTTPAYRRVSELQEKLKSAHDNMRSITEEGERTNQALQSANEEILASNEELQSMNEEMQTAREEIQATNDELQKRNTQLGEAYGDLNNLILSLGIASVLVDDELRILRFTPAAQKILNLIPNDVGRRITDISPNIDVSDLPVSIAEVIRTMSATEREVQDTDGHWYTMRIRPYKTDSGRIAGAVMFLVSIDSLKRMQTALTESDEKWQELIDEPPDFILTPGGRILFVNQEFLDQTSNVKVGTSIYEAVESDDQATLKKTLETVCKTGRASAFTVTGTGPLHHAVLEGILMPIKSRGKLIALMMRTKQIQPIVSRTASLSNALTGPARNNR